jgi:hypothetical protein
MTAKAERKKKPALPKARRVWEISPETRVKPSEKIYRRGKTKKSWVEDIDWFGGVF